MAFRRAKQLLSTRTACRVTLTSRHYPPQDAKNFNAEVQRRRLEEAAAQIAPLQDAVDLGVATDEEKARLIIWKQYRVSLNRVDLVDPVWPEEPASS
ncbi:tail fiber assembly protein [Burkholderia sp. AW33-5]